MKGELSLGSLKMSALEQISEAAISGTELSVLLDKALNLITGALGVEYVAVLKSANKEKEFLLEAGAGWPKGLVGQMRVENARAGNKLPFSFLLEGREAVSSIQVAIRGWQPEQALLGAYTTAPREFSQEDANFMQAIANILSLAIARRQEEMPQMSEQRYQKLADAMPLMVWTAQPDGAVDYFNQHWFDYTGASFEQTKGWGWQSMVHPDDRHQCVEDWKSALDTNEPCEFEYRLLSKDGTYRWHLCRAVPIPDRQGEIISWVGTATDIDDRERDRQAERFLSQASQELANSLNYQATLERIARLAVPEIADWCAVDMLEPGQSAGSEYVIRRLAVAHADPSKVEWAKQLQERYPHDPNSQFGVPNVLRTGQSELYAEIPDSLLVEAARDAEHLEILRNVGFSSAMVVPTIARGRTLGAISFICDRSGRRYTAADLALAENLACRAALAVDNARLYEESQQAEARILHYASRLQLLVDASRSFAEVRSNFKAFAIPKEFLLKSAPPELEIVLDNLCQRLAKLTGDTCIIQMVSEDERWLHPVAIHDPKPETLAIMRQILALDRQSTDAEPFCRVIQTGRALLSNGELGAGEQGCGGAGVQGSVTFNNFRAEIFQLAGIHYFAIVPLVVQGRTIGLVTLLRQRADKPYTLDDRLFLQELADRAALAIANTRLFDAVQQELVNRALSEVALRESEQRFRTMADSASVLLWISGSDGLRTFFNQAWLNFTGRSPEEELGNGWREGVHPEDWQGYWDTYATAFQNRQSFQIEYRLQRESGEYGWIFEQAVPRFMSDGTFAGYTGSCIDITERKSVEEALQARAEELARLTSVLAKTNTALEKRNKELDQFAYIVSHDLKAPLRAIANLSQWIEEDVQDRLTSDTKHQMNLLRGRVHRMEALIEGILEYSRVGRVQTVKELVQVDDLLQNVIDSLVVPPKFTITVEPAMPVLMTEPLLLEQVFANLIGNAIGHHHRDDGNVNVSVQNRGEFYEFSVRDDGPGIAPQYHEKIFVIFQTLVARDRLENTGIGLSLVKKIVEDKGGSVWIESDEGKGATFCFTWPK